MNWIFDSGNIPLILCGVFYSVLCVFSIVTGLMYATGKRGFHTTEMSDKQIARLKTEEDRAKFAVKMGWVTFWVGIVQGLTAFSIFKAHSVLLYCIALGFTLFSNFSVAWKLKGKITAFPIVKAVFYISILVILLLKSSRALFF